MRFSPVLLCFAASLMLAGCATTTTTAPLTPPLFTDAIGARAKDATTLFVVVHGDGGERGAVDTTTFARALAHARPDAAVVRILRPGFADPAGNVSPGTRGANAGDDYTSAVIASVGDTIAALAARHRRANVVAIGEGGGAAIVANLAGLRSDLLDGMVLVSCPCALPEWRKHMASREKPPQPWREKVESLDPLQTAGGVSPSLRAAILTGAQDRVTLPRFSRSYAEALSLRGIATDFRIIPNRASQLLGDPQVVDAAGRLASTLPRKTR